MRILRKFLVVIILVAPLLMTTDCKKQAKCGCDGDVLFSLSNEPARVYWNEGGLTIQFNPLSNPLSTYYFCNPSEMFPKLSEAKSGDILLVSGHAYWECTYLMQMSNSYYGYSYKMYNIQVTDVYANLYGKK